MDFKKIIARLKAQKNPKDIADMSWFGISAENTFLQIIFFAKFAINDRIKAYY